MLRSGAFIFISPLRQCATITACASRKSHTRPFKKKKKMYPSASVASFPGANASTASMDSTTVYDARAVDMCARSYEKRSYVGAAISTLLALTVLVAFVYVVASYIYPSETVTTTSTLLPRWERGFVVFVFSLRSNETSLEHEHEYVYVYPLPGESIVPPSQALFFATRYDATRGPSRWIRVPEADAVVRWIVDVFVDVDAKASAQTITLLPETHAPLTPHTRVYVRSFAIVTTTVTSTGTAAAFYAATSVVTAVFIATKCVYACHDRLREYADALHRRDRESVPHAL